ncbi:MAG: CHAT domain-containing protein [Bradyrhizobium sp.]|uniref:CHAT domain-containing protein n=1 Tax=Bradyrhizobium sp. TaxID=376 RepID=UPI0025C0D7B2|nr:CHAT domain-containing protein [Bradyrhizobium sp.]MBI5262714.1 CHAT domain-containing protein [Bradyrhizobium sp.]
MRGRQAVVDPTGNYEENNQRLGKSLGQAKLRRRLFDVIYGRGSRPRSRKQLMTVAEIKPTDAQQAQNEIEYLYKKHLVARIANEGYADDGSHYVYLKDEYVRANRDDIVKIANNPKLAAKMATKRSPALNGKTVIVRQLVTPSALKKRKHLDVLYLMANPIRRYALRVDAEVTKVAEEIRRSLFRDNVTLHQLPAANLDTLIRGLNDHRPRIVHFSGHGSADGIAVDDGGIKRIKRQVLSFDILGKALSATDKPPDVVVLNACESVGARTALLQTAKAIIVMQDEISDLAAVAFAIKFYGGIASGQPLQFAFEQGCVAVESVSISEAATPVLITAKGFNPKKLILA